MKALNMSMPVKPPRRTIDQKINQPLTGGICRKELSPERIQELNRIHYQQRKAEKELKEWEAFCKTLQTKPLSLSDKVKEIRSKRPS